MEKNRFDNDPFRQPLTSTQKKNRRRKKNDEDEETSFMKRDVNIMDSIFFPEGLENIMGAVYFLAIPYIAGTLFIFFYIGKGDYTIFLALNNENSFLITWAIGYEIVATLVLLWIGKLALKAMFQMDRGSGANKKFRIP